MLEDVCSWLGWLAGLLCCHCKVFVLLSGIICTNCVNIIFDDPVVRKIEEEENKKTEEAIERRALEEMEKDNMDDHPWLDI